MSDRPKQYPWQSRENCPFPVRFSSWRIDLFPCLQLSRSSPLKGILWRFSHLFQYKTLFIHVHLTLFPAPTRIAFNKNKLLVLATGAESGKSLSSYLQNSFSTPTLHSQNKDKNLQKYWYANAMGLAILCILCIYLQTCKGGLYRTNGSSAHIFKTCTQSVTSFYLSRCWQIELPWFCLNSAVRTVSTLPILSSVLL